MKGRSCGMPSCAAEAEKQGCKVKVCPVEVDCRGFVASSTIMLLKDIGIRGQGQWKTFKELSTVSKRSCRLLWLKRKETVWTAK